MGASVETDSKGSDASRRLILEARGVPSDIYQARRSATPEGNSLSDRLAYGSHVPWFGEKRLTADRGMLCTWRPWLGEWEGAVGGWGRKLDGLSWQWREGAMSRDILMMKWMGFGLIRLRR